MAGCWNGLSISLITFLWSGGSRVIGAYRTSVLQVIEITLVTHQGRVCVNYKERKLSSKSGGFKDAELRSPRV